MIFLELTSRKVGAKNVLARSGFHVFCWHPRTGTGSSVRTERSRLPSASQQREIPEWCKPLPRPEYKSLQRIPVSDPWFEVYNVAPNTIAIYEPHQSEETISYLILGKDKALLLDTGMGISDLRKVVSELTPLPIIVVNSHTHDDHVGGNWQFPTIYSMDTDFSRANAKGSSADAQAEIASGEICGDLPRDFNAKTYRTKPWTISKYIHDGDTIDLGGRTVEILSTPGHTPDAICLLRPRQRPALHRRYLLPRRHLALSPGNRPRCVCEIYCAPLRTCASGKNCTWPAQYSRGSAFRPPQSGQRIRRASGR